MISSINMCEFPNSPSPLLSGRPCSSCFSQPTRRLWVGRGAQGEMFLSKSGGKDKMMQWAGEAAEKGKGLRKSCVKHICLLNLECKSPLESRHSGNRGRRIALKELP